MIRRAYNTFCKSNSCTPEILKEVSKQFVTSVCNELKKDPQYITKHVDAAMKAALNNPEFINKIMGELTTNAIKIKEADFCKTQCPMDEGKPTSAEDITAETIPDNKEETTEKASAIEPNSESTDKKGGKNTKKHGKKKKTQKRKLKKIQTKKYKTLQNQKLKKIQTKKYKTKIRGGDGLIDGVMNQAAKGVGEFIFNPIGRAVGKGASSIGKGVSNLYNRGKPKNMPEPNKNVPFDNNVKEDPRKQNNVLTQESINSNDYINNNNNNNQRGQVLRIDNPQPAYPQPAYPQPAYPQPAYPQPAYPHPAYPQPAYPPKENTENVKEEDPIEKAGNDLLAAAATPGPGGKLAAAQAMIPIASKIFDNFSNNDNDEKKTHSISEYIETAGVNFENVLTLAMKNTRDEIKDVAIERISKTIDNNTDTIKTLILTKIDEILKQTKVTPTDKSNEFKLEYVPVTTPDAEPPTPE